MKDGWWWPAEWVRPAAKNRYSAAFEVKRYKDAEEFEARYKHIIKKHAWAVRRANTRAKKLAERP